MIETIAQNLYQTYNFRPGDHFGFYSPNQMEYVLVAIAVWRLRGVIAGINPLLKPGESPKSLLRPLSLAQYYSNRPN